MKTLLQFVLVLITVTSVKSQNIIYVSPTGGGTGETTNSPIDLQSAIDTALVNGEDDILYLQEGSYTSTPYTAYYQGSDAMNIALIGGWSSNYSTQSDNISATAISGTNNERLFLLNGIGAAVDADFSMEMMLLENGQTASENGAGILVAGGQNDPDDSNIHLVINKVEFLNNQTTITGSGGAIYTDCSFNISDAYFNRNTAASNGGALFVGQRTINFMLERNVSNSTFKANKNTGNQGSSIWTVARTMNIENSEFKGEDNGGSSGNGSSVYVANGGTVNIDRCEFSNITINYWGSAVQVWDANAEISNSLFVNNKAGANNGYGTISFYHNNSVDREVKITNCTFADNASQNFSPLGGGVHFRGNGNDALKIYNSIFYNNGPSPLYKESGDASITNSLSEFAATNFDSETDVIIDDPQLNTDYRLTSNSPCIDAGSITYISPEWTDLDGATRVLGENVDMGSYEYNAVPLGVSLTNNTIDENNAPNFLVAILSTDGQTGDSHTYELHSGNGTNDADNGSFTIVNDELHITPSTNFETQSSYFINLLVRDSRDQTAETAHIIMIADINESPELSGVLADKTAQVDANMSFSFNANVFNDPDLGDELTYTSTLDNGNLLPSWLSFNPNTITYSGIPPMIEDLEIKLIATDRDGLSAAGTFTLNITPSVGIENLSRSNIKVYPNPATNTISIELNEAKELIYTIYDPLGTELFQNSYKAANLDFPIDHLSKGYYFIQIKGDEGQLTIPFIKQ